MPHLFTYSCTERHLFPLFPCDIEVLNWACLGRSPSRSECLSLGDLLHPRGMQISALPGVLSLPSSRPDGRAGLPRLERVGLADEWAAVSLWVVFPWFIERLSCCLLATWVFFFMTSLFITPNHSSIEFLCLFFLSICKRLDLKALVLRQIPKCAVTFIFDKNSQWMLGKGNIRAVLLRKRQVKEREKQRIFTKVFRT